MFFRKFQAVDKIPKLFNESLNERECLDNMAIDFDKKEKNNNNCSTDKLLIW